VIAFEFWFMSAFSALGWLTVVWMVHRARERHERSEAHHEHLHRQLEQALTLLRDVGAPPMR